MLWIGELVSLFVRCKNIWLLYMVLSSIFARGVVSQKGGASDLISLLAKNRVFLFKIFANLIAQLGITYYAMEHSSREKNPWIRIGYAILSLVLVIIIAGTNLPPWVKFFIFVAFSALFGKMMTRYKEKYGDEVVKAGILGAMSIFAVMFIVGAMLPVLGPQVGLALFIALLASSLQRL